MYKVNREEMEKASQNVAQDSADKMIEKRQNNVVKKSSGFNLSLSNK